MYLDMRPGGCRGGRAQVRDPSVKIFVFTSYRSSTGPGQVREAKQLAKLIDSQRLSKNQVLKLRVDMRRV